ncbi:MAG: PIN domain-containing protein [Planctomycetota bacterium]|nr:PIN domain-containing protein [Planctomycetota bacterium]
MIQIFFYTGYILALELANDQNYQAAQQHWRRFAAAPPSLVTTSYVFDEVVTFFSNRGHHGKAVQVGNNLLASAALKLVHVDEELFDAGWEYLQRHDDKRYSLTDCISFVLMERLGIATAYSFDHHFRQAGFQTEP